VVCWRRLAEHVGSSLRKGDPVVVYGSLRTRAWRKENRSGHDIEIVARTVGHDMSQGTSMFTKAAPRRDALAASTEQVLAQLAESLREETEGELDGMEGSIVFGSSSPFPDVAADVRGVGVPVGAAGALPSRPVEEEPDTRPGLSSAPTDTGEQTA
ncbi:MAG TPA: single-stranded DNA-binding protein, partial [Microlunatus sp.]|nr:single-stranded DNA-binding protein [Microlunatus sp.]